MNKKTTGHCWNGSRSWFSDAIGGAWRSARRGMDASVAVDSPLYGEVRALTGSHLPVLIHKRGRCSQNCTADEISRWTNELESFVMRVVWPHLVDKPVLNGRSKADIVKLVGEIVAAEQQKAAEMKADDSIPHTSRFDTSWAL